MRGRGPEETLPADLNCWSFYLCQSYGSDTGTGSVSSTQWACGSSLQLDTIQMFYLLLRQTYVKCWKKWSVSAAETLLIEHFQVSFQLNLSYSAILSHNGLHLYSNHCVLKEAHCLPASHYVTYMHRDLAMLLFYFVWGTVELLMITRLKAHVFGPGSVLKWRLSCTDSAFACAFYLPSSKVIDDCVYCGV